MKNSIPNPALKPFAVLIGEWNTVGTHPYLPGTTLRGHSSFTWIQDGAFLLWKSEIRHEAFPKGIAIIGSDDSKSEYSMLYFDDRKISRRYEVSADGTLLKWWRDASDLSQRFTWSVAADGNTIISFGELSKDRATWEKDLELTFTRLGPEPSRAD